MSLGTLGLIAASVAIRLLSRGGDVPGWDILSAADGLWYVSTMSWRQLVGALVSARSHEWYNLGPSLFPVLVPGLLTSWMPWLYWGAVVVALVVAVSFALLARALAVPWWVVGLAWVASPALVSNSIIGLGHATGMLPHALAMVIVWRLRDRPLLTLALWGLEYVLAWHVQDLGRTAFVVFLAAGVALRAPWTTRAIWLLAGAAQGWDAWAHPTHISFVFTSGAIPSPARLVRVMGEVAQGIFVTHWSDLPVLVSTGIVALAALRRERVFWMLVAGVQAGLVFCIALHDGPLGVFPRRMLVLDYYAVAVIAALWGQRSRARPWLAAALVLGACWQLADAVAFARAPRGEFGFPLPFTSSTFDYQVVYQDVDWAKAASADVAAGRHVVLIYNQLAYEENCTNPAGIAERVAVSVGWTAYRERLLWFGDPVVCWTHLTPRPLSDVDGVVAGITEPRDWVVWEVSGPSDATFLQPRQGEQRAAIRRALERRFTLVATPVTGLRGGSFTINRYVLATRGGG